MTTKKFPIPPGVDRQGSKHSIGARWYESQNMRFRDQYPESIGGWEEDAEYAMNGIPRGIHSWTDFSDNQYICVGTTFKFYILVGPTQYDITPNRLDDETLSITDPLATTSGSSVITVTDSNHGCSLNDFVRFVSVSDSDIAGIASTIFTDEVEGYQIFSIVDDNTFQIDLSSGSQTGTLTASSTSASEGGTVVVDYRIASGSASEQSGSGFGVGGYGGDDFVPTEYSLGGSPNVATTSGLSTVVVQTNGIPANPFVVGDYIYIKDMTDTVGGLDMTVLNNKWWFVSLVVGGNAYISHPGGNATATTNGQANANFYHDDISAGGVVGASRGWGDASAESIVTGALRQVTIQNFGEDLIFCNRGSPLYYYDTSANVSSGVPEQDNPAVVIASSGVGAISGATECPEIVDSFLVSEQHGHVIAFATNDIGSSSQNKMLIRWSDRHNPFVWLPTNSNEAGGRVLREGSEILGGIQTKGEIIVFTNKALYSCRYTGFPDTYGFETVSKNVTAYSRGSFAAVDNVVYFMGRDQFYKYDGSVQPLPKNVVNYVFDDINEGQKDKCFSGVNSKFTEVYWFYPSSDSFEPNRWVSYNYSNETWTHGSFDMSALDQSAGSGSSANRTAWEDVNVFDTPQSPYVTNYDPSTLPETQKSSLMKHESGRSANGDAITHTIESGQIDVTEGDAYMHWDRILPDVEIFDRAEGATMPTVTLSIDGRNLPGRQEHSSSAITVDFSDNAVSGLDYAPDYKNTSIRGRGRTLSFRATSSSTGYGWRLGTLRLNMKPDGKRG